MDLTSKSLTELNLMTKAQLITALTENRQETRTIISEGDRRGQTREVRETRDVTGKLVSRQEVTWTYYPAGNVDTITISEADAEGKPIGKPQVIPHAESGGLATGKMEKVLAASV